MSKRNQKEGYRTKGFERFAYGLFFFGESTFYSIIATFLITYFSDIGIPAATVAIVTLIIKVWDAVNDPIFGGIVDKVKLKKGKFLPWVRVSMVFIPVATVLLFAIPSTLNMAAKVTWAIIAYMLWDTAYTVCDVPIYGVITTVTDNQQERTVMMTLGRFFSMTANMTAMILIPAVRKMIGGWLPTVLILSCIAALAMFPFSAVGKERVAAGEQEEEIGIRDMLRYVLTNKYLLIYFAGYTIFGISNIGMALNMQFSRYCLGDEKWMSVLSLVSVVPIYAACFVGPSLAKKIDKIVLYRIAFAGMAVMGTIMYFVGYDNVVVYLILSAIRVCFMGIYSVFMFMFMPDCVEYGTYKTGLNATGSAFAFQAFCAKLQGAVSTALAAAMLAVIHFVPGEGAIQEPGFAGALWNVMFIVPTTGLVLALIVLSRYKLRDKDVQIMAKANRKEITREEAEKLLGGRY